ncbi:release factor glutamine methyltransferase [Filimonas lacunae]|uniref:peptide chain release factor N(5)-glutamine methyltransferase n=1 Tax=Filimonas lacunae TaxID=477680 RepID=A0A173ML77_9BACT|nr:peptide chain release factor N(5)-glutamine methyltransferase [Filimonas lacunae]BAV08402.1 glutamine methyltransferase [Filimonas lacunae]SIT33513.1 release factor glutamine methyltransferase [Filimonas lacunae]
MTVQEAYKRTQEQLAGLYDSREATNIAELVIVHITGLSRTDRLIHGTRSLTHSEANQLTLYTLQLLQSMPLQYVLEEAWFANMPFLVNAHVLIPRPETEELVEWIVQEATHLPAPALLDIGTGSGCIPIAIKKQLPQAQVHALDISLQALAVARQNAAKLEAAVTFHQADILQPANWTTFPVFDVVVSNPPYIREMEKVAMHSNVLEHEPHLALFVPDRDALLFYRTIAVFAQQHLKAQGLLFFEINEALGEETVQLLAHNGFTQIELKKDMQGKDRMIKAVKAG